MIMRKRTQDLKISEMEIFPSPSTSGSTVQQESLHGLSDKKPQIRAKKTGPAYALCNEKKSIHLWPKEEDMEGSY